MAAGTQIGTFHPLVAFADTERAIAALHGVDPGLRSDRLRRTLGRSPLRPRVARRGPVRLPRLFSGPRPPPRLFSRALGLKTIAR